jgi:hypothetical protein
MSEPRINQSLINESRPASYPVPSEDGQLFYIQRNLSQNSVIYCLNFTPDGLVNLSNPMNVYWIRYDNNNEVKPLNFIQQELAYGYKHDVISSDLIKFNFVCYAKDFFITKVDGLYKVVSSFNGENFIINRFFVHAEERGAFPVIHFVEIDLTHLTTGKFEKVRLEFLN